jgi:hypothetical protein
LKKAETLMIEMLRRQSTMFANEAWIDFWFFRRLSMRLVIEIGMPASLAGRCFFPGVSLRFISVRMRSHSRYSFGDRRLTRHVQGSEKRLLAALGL